MEVDLWIFDEPPTAAEVMVMTMRIVYLLCEGAPGTNIYFLLKKQIEAKRGLELGAFDVTLEISTNYSFRNNGKISKVKLATIVEGNPKAPFSIATTPRCRGGRYSFPGLLYFILDPYLIMPSVKQGGIKYHFLSL